jgi:threonyl-tRNA synthetase
MAFLTCKSLNTALTFSSTWPREHAFSDIGKRGDSQEYDDVSIIFVCVEKGDERNPNVSEEGARVAATELQTMKFKDAVLIPFAHLTRQIAEPKFAYAATKEMKRRLEGMGFTMKQFRFGWHRELFLHLLCGAGNTRFRCV